MERKPRFEYTGQSSDEVLAHIETHSAFDVMGGLRWCIEAKARAQGGEDKLAHEERLFLAVLDLVSEVNNGGYHQFFWNSSRRFTPIIVDSLRRIDCERTAELTERAIAALRLSELTADAVTEEIQRENPERDARLENLSDEFYTFDEVTDQLLQFLVAASSKIQAPRTEDYPRFPKPKKPSNASSLYHALAFWKKGWNPTLDEARQAAEEIAKERSIPATDAEIRGATALFYLDRIIKTGELDGSEGVAQEAFTLMRNAPVHIVVYRKWVEAALAQGKANVADLHSVEYLGFLKQGGRDAESLQNEIIFWARLVHEHRRELPGSVAFFEEHFPHMDLANLPAERLILPAKELRKRTKPPTVELQGDNV